MPLVQVSVRQGRPPESIRTMISAVTAAVADSLGAAPESIRVIVTEVPLTHWATGDVTLHERRQRASEEVVSPPDNAS